MNIEFDKSNLIYAYKKKDINKIVYVGQTTNLFDRHRQHMDYDPFNKNTREYNYPLSRGIRKNGQEAYELIILENNLPQEKMDEREIFWISYYDTYFNGYNQTIGGKKIIKPVYSNNKIDQVIGLLKDEKYSFNEIKKLTGLSITHIYNINKGLRRKKDGLLYPIREENVKGTKGLKFNKNELELIHQDLFDDKLNLQEIAKKYNCDSSTISRINYGKTKKYRLENIEYPIRKSPHSISKQLYWNKNK